MSESTLAAPIVKIVSFTASVRNLRDALKTLTATAPPSMIAPHHEFSRTFLACFGNEAWLGAQANGVKMLTRIRRAETPGDALHGLPLDRVALIAKTIKPENDVRITFDDGAVLTLESHQVNGLRSVFNLACGKVDAITLPEPCGLDCWSIPARDFADAIESAKVAIGPHSRFDTDGVMVEARNEHLQLIGTDGHRLSCVRVEALDSGPNAEVLIPSAALKAVLAVCKSAGDGFVRFRVDADPETRMVSGSEVTTRRQKLSIRTDDVILEITCDDASYPKYRAILETSYPSWVEFRDPAAFVKVVEQARKTTDPDGDGRRLIQLVGGPGGFFVAGGSARVNVQDVFIRGTAYDRTINVDLLLPYLKTVAKLGNLRMWVPVGNGDAIRFNTLERGQFFLMPMKADAKPGPKVKPSRRRKVEVAAGPAPEPTVADEASPEPGLVRPIVATPEPEPEPEPIATEPRTWGDVKPGDRILHPSGEIMTVESIHKSWDGINVKVAIDGRPEIMAKLDQVFDVVVGPTPPAVFSGPDPEPEPSGPSKRLVNHLCYDVVQTVEPGTNASYRPGTWLCQSFATLKEAREYAGRCNSYCTCKGIRYSVTCTHDEAPGRHVKHSEAPKVEAGPIVDPVAPRTIPADVNRVEQLGPNGKSFGDTYRRYHGQWRHERLDGELPNGHMDWLLECGRIVFLPDMPVVEPSTDYGHASMLAPPSGAFPEVPALCGGSPEAATVEEEQAPPLASIRIEPREITDEFREEHRANVLAETERNIRLEVLGFLDAHIPTTGEPDMEWLTFRAGFNWRRMGGDERQDFRTWCEAIGYIPGLGNYGFLADDERWQAFLEECVTGSPIDHPPTVDPDDPDNYNSRWNRNPGPAPERGRAVEVGNLVILFTSLGSPCHSASTADIPPTPLLNFSGPTTLRIGGTPYGLEATPDGWDLCKPDGTSYRLAMGQAGPSCECGDFTHRRAGLDSLGCKHIRAAREAGLIPPVTSTEATMDTPTIDGSRELPPVSGGSPEQETHECPRGHGTMTPRPLSTQTEEQKWCGTWYDCPTCYASVLIMSEALKAHRESLRIIHPNG